MATLSGAEYNRLKNQIAVAARIDAAKLLTLTLTELRAMWRAINNEPDPLLRMAVAQARYEETVKKMQPAYALSAAGLYVRSQQLYAASGHAPKGFVPKEVNPVKFMEGAGPRVVYNKGHREFNYFRTLVEAEEVPLARLQRKSEQIAQKTLMNTHREFIFEEAVEDDFTMEYETAASSSDDFGLEMRYEERPVVDLDEEDEPDEDEWAQEAFKENKPSSPVETNVRGGACEFCRLMALYRDKAKLHDDCSCIDLPNWAATVRTVQQPEWMNDVEDQANAARDYLLNSGQPINTRNIAKAIRNGDADRLLRGERVENSDVYDRHSIKGRKQAKTQMERAEEKLREVEEEARVKRDYAEKAGTVKARNIAETAERRLQKAKDRLEEARETYAEKRSRQ